MGIVIDKRTKLYIEECAYSGVRKVATRVANDLSNVFGDDIEVTSNIQSNDSNYILIATLGHTELTNKYDFKDILGKREVYKITILDNHLAIIGSDKRGTIYGLFKLSEMLGVSPFTDWFLIKPGRLDFYEVDNDYCMVSKEPSVKYRGFFINDEWPAFGNWCNHNFGGFNAKAYEEIFYLLLRLKGNYMWPAMWSAIFPEDGPNLSNAILADELGIIMGMSHHEPCLRQGEEYKYLRGKDSVYGDAWNFRTNEAGITRFWEDGLKRSGRFENVITVGMRGEADTAIMGREATLKDNIDLLRDVLRTQNNLMREHVNADLEKVPRMLALYKEVEPFFYGDENTKGLIGDEELEGVTLLLCDDNYGNLRTVPTNEMKNHKGGYGMYYHFDYHGLPVSYEWVNSSYLPKVWEQMTYAYETGISELWIVNVGDLFSMEYPVSFFLDLAYDYEKWGITNLDSASEYTKAFIEKTFNNRIDEGVKNHIYKLLMGYTKIANMRRVEAMNDNVYAPFNYNESNIMLTKIHELMGIADETERLVAGDLDFAVFALVTYPVKATLNAIKMWIYTGLNHACASIGDTRALGLAKLINECLLEDERLVDRLHTIENGKLYGMGLSEHIGFKNWCEEECQYPVVHSFKPGNKERIIVSVGGTNQHTEGGVWTGRELVMGDFLDPNNDVGVVELSAAGKDAAYEISCDRDYIHIDRKAGQVSCGEAVSVKVTLDRTSFAGRYTEDVATVTVSSAAGKSFIKVPVREMTDCEKYPKGTYIWCGLREYDYEKYNPYQYISMRADGYIRKNCGKAISDGVNRGLVSDFKILPKYGRYECAIKAFPVNETYDVKTAPSVTYAFTVPRKGDYCISSYINPSNAPYRDGKLVYGVQIGDGKIKEVSALLEGHEVKDGNKAWSEGVLNNIRISTTSASLDEGYNELSFYSLTPGFVLEKVVIFEKEKAPDYSYLGPLETYQL